MDATLKYDYIGRDLAGFRYNRKYPPNSDKYGFSYLGYKNWNREVFFFEFAVQGYDISFMYKGNIYYIMCLKDGAARCSVPFNNIIEKYSSPNQLIEQMSIDGCLLIEIIDELENVSME